MIRCGNCDSNEVQCDQFRGKGTSFIYTCRTCSAQARLENPRSHISANHQDQLKWTGGRPGKWLVWKQYWDTGYGWGASTPAEKELHAVFFDPMDAGRYVDWQMSQTNIWTLEITREEA